MHRTSIANSNRCTEQLMHRTYIENSNQCTEQLMHRTSIANSTRCTEQLMHRRSIAKNKQSTKQFRIRYAYSRYGIKRTAQLSCPKQQSHMNSLFFMSAIAVLCTTATSQTSALTSKYVNA